MTDYRNPVLDADWPDPDVIRVDDTYYLVASSFNRAPGLPILSSTDLVDWHPVTHALPAVPPIEHHRLPRHGCGVWAPALRHHDGRFWIFYPDPDQGIYVLSAPEATGPWTEPHLLFPGLGLIDPCPLWDDDGRAYLVHGWAGSRAGIKNRLSVIEMTPDAHELRGPGRVVIDGDQLPGYRTLEGPKVYRRDGWYWIFAPAGGVTDGWQSVFRSRSIWGPYEDRIVLAQGGTDINGPHQGAWVDTPDGDHWFVHFSDQHAFGRVTHLQPMRWADDGWPEMGRPTVDGPGEPVRTHPRPVGRTGPGSLSLSDDFAATSLSPQWHWQANPSPDWVELAGDGVLRLTMLANDPGNLRHLPQVLSQVLPGGDTTAETTVRLPGITAVGRAGLVVLGEQYGWIGLEATDTGVAVVARGGGQGPMEHALGSGDVGPAGPGGPGDELAEHRGRVAEVGRPGETISVQVRVRSNSAARCRFDWRPGPSEPWRDVGVEFRATAGRWVGAELGLFATAPFGSLAGSAIASVAELGPVRVMSSTYPHRCVVTD